MSVCTLGILHLGLIGYLPTRLSLVLYC